MSTRDLASILLSGEITAINKGGTDADSALMSRGEIRDALQPAGIMLWKGPWASDQTYNEHYVVLDGAWLMIANKSTQQRPAPNPVGDPKYSMEPPPVFNTLSDESTIYSGHKYVFTKAGWVTELLVYAPEVTPDTHYRVIVVDNTIPSAPITSVIDEPILIEDGWARVSLGRSIVTAGTELIIYLEAINEGSSQAVTGGWQFNGNSNAGAPTCPGGWNRDNGGTALRICNVDLDSTDRNTELLGMVPGTIIRFAETAQPNNYQEFLVTGVITDNPSGYVDVPCTINDAGGTLGQVVTTMTADIPIAQATQYNFEADYHLANQPDFADVEGFLQFDGVAQPGVENYGFGVAMLFQEATVSDDWDLLAYSDLSGGSSGGGSGGGGTYDFKKESGITIVDDTYQEVARLAVTRNAGLYQVAMSFTWTLNSTTQSGFFRWSIDGGVTFTEFQSEPKDITNKSAVYYAYPLNHDGGVFDFIVQMRKENPADIMSVEFIDLIFESKG